MNPLKIVRDEYCKLIAQHNDAKILRMMNTMQPNYNEQQRQNMKKFVRSL